VLAESGRILASSLDYQQTLHNVAQIAVPALADWCAVDLVYEDLTREHVVVAHRDEERRKLAHRLRSFEPDKLDPEVGAGRVFRTGTSELFPEITDQQLVGGAKSEEHLTLLRELQMRSVVIVPMRVPARTIGVMTLVTAESRRRLTPEDVELAEQLARRAAVAVENARLHTRLVGIAETLQQSLLPDELPEVRGWQVASLYRPAEAEQRIDVGGDFFELIEAGDCWVALIGDVTGKGIAAASLTALMRYGARFASRLEPQPAAILSRLDEELQRRPGSSLCTALCLQLRPSEVVISSAGHPPALIVDARGNVREVPAPGPLLGAFEGSEWPEQTVPVSPEELILIYTDGVTDTPGSQERFGLDRLRALLAENAGATPDLLLERLDQALDAFRGAEPRDDVAALAFRPRR
jgi:serine phosphatase RsbU (regulator of sigma subunit)